MNSAIRLLLFLSLAATPAAAADWGVDAIPGAGPSLLKNAREDLAKILKAPEKDRGALAKDLVERKGPQLVEVLKRFRNPELRPVVVAMLQSQDWQIAHRGLLMAEAFDDKTLLPDAWKLLGHERARMREKAAIACIKLWDAEVGRKISGGDAALMLGGMIEREKDPHARTCLLGLKAAMAGKLGGVWVNPEFVVTLEDELKVAPVVEGFAKIGETAPGWRREREPQRAERGAESMAAAAKWTSPVLGWTAEEILSTGRLAFSAQARSGSAYHAGVDVAACLDGAGLYAIAEGVVRLIRTGGPEGTAIVVEHSLGRGELVNAVYLHAGDAVFVAAGDKVACGQLLGTVGMSFSTMNGGVTSHLHFALYPGPFDEARLNEEVADLAGIGAWLDPKAWLEARVEESKSPVEIPTQLNPAFEGVERLMEKAEYGRAWGEAMKIVAGKGVDEAMRSSAQRVTEAIRKGAQEVIGRAQRKREAGYPQEAMEILKSWAPEFRGCPPGTDIENTMAVWPRNEAYKKEVTASKEFTAAEMRVKTLQEKGAAKEEIRAVWEGLLKKFGETYVKERIQRKIDLLK
ncbi:MAG: M23 family metallopeptidase [Planctomycetes bacterium]|nr:M23 family metallopeptidase [Planctomycetota bacterium]